MISECERALNALMLQPTPYDPDYVEGLYLYYTYSDDDFYPRLRERLATQVGQARANPPLFTADTSSAMNQIR
jgi:hypothetical protein